MAYNNRNSRSNDRYQDNRGSRSSSRSNRGGQQRKTTQTYHPLFTIYLGYPDGQNKMNFSIKPFEDREGNPTEITKEQWLAIASDMYDGEFVLRGTLWEHDGEFSQANGNLRLTGDELEQYPAQRRTKSKAQAPRGQAKPKYTEPEVDEEEIDFYEDETETEEDLPM